MSPTKPKLNELPAEIRLRIIQHYVLLHNPALEGDWTSDEPDFPEKECLPLLQVNRKIRDEAFPIAQELFIVLPRYRYLPLRRTVYFMRFYGPRKSPLVNPTTHWWTQMQTFCVTSMEQYRELSELNMPNLRRMIVNWHHFSGGGTRPQSLGHLETCAPSETIQFHLLSADSKNRYWSDINRSFWGPVQEDFPRQDRVNTQLLLFATVLTKCGILVGLLSAPLSSINLIENRMLRLISPTPLLVASISEQAHTSRPGSGHTN